MRTRSLLLIATIASLVGLIVLALIRPDVSPQLMQLEGTIERIDRRGSVTFIQFTPSNFTVVSFSEETFTEGDFVLVGRLQPYKGKVEFVVDSTRGILVGK